MEGSISPTAGRAARQHSLAVTPTLEIALAQEKCLTQGHVPFRMAHIQQLINIGEKDSICSPQQRTNWMFHPNSRAANRVRWVLHWDVSPFLLSSCLSNVCSRTLVNILMLINDAKSTSQKSKTATFEDLFPQLLWMLLENSHRMLDSFILCLSPRKLIKSCLLPGPVPIQWLINVVTERSITVTPIWDNSERPFYTQRSPWHWQKPSLGLHCCSTSAQFSFCPVSSPVPGRLLIHVLHAQLHLEICCSWNITSDNLLNQVLFFTSNFYLNKVLQ